MTVASAAKPEASRPSFVPPRKESRMQKLIKRFRRDEDGAALVEYGMLVGLIAVVCVLTIKALGQTISEYFSYISSELPAA